MASNGEVTDLVLTVAGRCLAMQTEHLAALKAGNLTNIHHWLEERQAVVACLRQAMAQLRPAELDADLRGQLMERLATIVDGEELLFAVAAQQRTQLGEKVTAIRRGRRALRGYGPATTHRVPCFVSDNR